MTDVVIRVENLGKRYRIGQKERQPETFREAAVALVGSPFRYLRKMSRPPTEAETLWALRNVSFEVRRGEAVGIIGRNGAGKSTLLKILSRITEPTEGRALVNGRVGSLLEVGTGFHPELTGRENIYLSGAIRGMRRREIDRKFDEIVSFSEVEQFLDTPIKRYSSGMYVRLAFSVAAYLEPEIMIVDEVLSVGDVAFRQKCQARMARLAQAGLTIFFVSHNMQAVRRLCHRVIWLQAGGLRMDGEVDDGIEAYLSSVTQAASGEVNREDDWAESQDGRALGVQSSREHGLTIQEVELKNCRGESTARFRPGEELRVEIQFEAKQRIRNPYVWITVDSSRGPCFAANMLIDGHQPDILEGTGRVACRFKSLPLLPQGYVVRLAIRASDGETAIVPPQEVAFFRVHGEPREFGLMGHLASTLVSTSVPVMIPYEWILPDGMVMGVDLGAGDSVAQPVGPSGSQHIDGREANLA